MPGEGLEPTKAADFKSGIDLFTNAH